MVSKAADKQLLQLWSMPSLSLGTTALDKLWLQWLYKAVYLVQQVLLCAAPLSCNAKSTRLRFCWMYAAQRPRCHDTGSIYAAKTDAFWLEPHLR